MDTFNFIESSGEMHCYNFSGFGGRIASALESSQSRGLEINTRLLIHFMPKELLISLASLIKRKHGPLDVS